ncbi:MAG: hypothetical protein AB8F95_14275 [Bacteroidia bacterium]
MILTRLATAFSIISVSFFCTFSHAQSNEGLFDSQDVLPITFSFDVGRLQRNREVSPKYQDATMSFRTPDGDSTHMKVQIKARGNFRRTDGTCKLPPLRVRFSKNDTIDPFDGGRRLKLVTLCQEECYILREYLVYKLYQELSEYSLKVRICRITYADETGKEEPVSACGFFIEDIPNFAAGVDATELDTTSYSLDAMNRDLLTLVHMFQYMIGNPDHHPDRLQNTKLIQPNDGSAPIPVPYDFDWSGMVDASYTKMEGYTGGLFTKRRFVPLCRTLDEFMAAGDIFRAKRAAMESLITEAKFLNDADREHMLNYINDFFKVINSKGKVKKLFVKSCKK